MKKSHNLRHFKEEKETLDLLARMLSCYSLKALVFPLYVKQKSDEEKRRKEVQVPSQCAWKTKQHLETGLFSTMPMMFLVTWGAFKPVGSEDVR